MKKKSNRMNKHRFGIFLKILSTLLVIIMLFVGLDKEVRPVIITMAQYQARVSSILAINNAVIDEMENLDDDIKLTKVFRAENGIVTAVETNTSELNKLKAKLTNAVGVSLATLELTDISIPIGTLLGWQIFAGRGPDVNFKILPTSFVESNVTSTLTSAGINQTMHQIFIEFKVTMSAIIPGYTTNVEVKTDVCIAETLIVGVVPEFFAGTTK